MTDLRRPEPTSPHPDGVPRVAPAAARLVGLDGIRGLAALFVVLHHCWLSAYPGFPYTATPAWTGWLAFGHLAVVVFIVLSGFSLAVGPARAGWQLGGLRRFLKRRAWRILPPYWAALVFSLAMAWLVVPQPGEGPPTARSVIVFGALLQDVFGSPSPNGPFWSIAIEVQLYLVLPLMILVRRRWGAVPLLGLVAAPAIAVEVLSPQSSTVALFERFTPQMAVLFALGVVAAGVVRAERPWLQGLPWGVLAASAAVPPIVLIAVAGRVWVVDHFFWVDLAVAPSVALLLAALAAGRARPVARPLGTRPLRLLGSFSYSLYLVHAPLVVALSSIAAAAGVAGGVPRLLVLVAVAVPTSVVVAWAFSRVFEIPFQRHRSARELVGALRDAFLSARQRPQPS